MTFQVGELNSCRPEDFGAYGDGIHNDSKAVQLALNSGNCVLGSPEKTYLVSNITITDNQYLDGQGATFKPYSAGSPCITLKGYKPVIKNCRFDDIASTGNTQIMVSSTVAVNVSSGLSLTLTDATSFQIGDICYLKLDTGRHFVSSIKNKVGNVLTLAEAVPSLSTAGNIVYGGKGLLCVGDKDGAYTSFFRVEDIHFENSSACIYLKNCGKGIISNIRADTTRFACITGQEVNDTDISKVQMWGSYTQTENFVGTGAQTAFVLNNSASLIRDITVYVNGVLKSNPADYTLTADGFQVVFGSAPVNGASITVYNQVNCCIGLYFDNSSGTTPFVGNMSDIGILTADTAMKCNQVGQIITNCVLDTCTNGLEVYGVGAAVPLSFTNTIISFINSVPVQTFVNANSSAGVVYFSARLQTTLTPAAYLPSLSQTGYDIINNTNCSVFIDLNSWSSHDANTITGGGASQVYFTGNNQILGIDGNASAPSYSFASSPTIGLYKLSNTRVGVSGTAILTNTDAALGLGNDTASNNPSINFFSSNTGTYNTASSRIQAYGGTGSANSGTIEVDCATLQCVVGISGNKNQSLAPYVFSGASGVSGLTVQSAIAVREGTYNRLNITITGNMSASAAGSFSLALFERTTNWSTAYQIWGTGDCLIAPPSAPEISGVLIQSQAGTTNAQFSFAFNSTGATSNAFQMTCSIYYQRL